MSFTFDSVHEPLAEDSLIVHNVFVESVTVTVPVGVKPEYCGETVTDKCSTCSCPYVTFVADSLRPVLEVALTGVTELEAAELGPVPTVLIAATVKV